MSLWLAVARAEAPNETIAARMAAVLALTSTVEERLADAGVAGMSGALDVHRRLVAVLAAVDAGRLAALQRAVAALEHEVRHAARVLARLRELKEVLDVPEEGPRPRSDRA